MVSEDVQPASDRIVFELWSVWQQHYVLNHCATLPRLEGCGIQVRSTGPAVALQTPLNALTGNTVQQLELQGGGSPVGYKGLSLQVATVCISGPLGEKGIATMATRGEDFTYDCDRSSECGWHLGQEQSVNYPGPLLTTKGPKPLESPGWVLSTRKLVYIVTGHIMLFISVYPTRVHLKQALPSHYVIFLSLSRDAADQSFLPWWASLCLTTALSCQSFSLWLHLLYSWGYKRIQGIGSVPKVRTRVDEAGVHESGLERDLVWLVPPFAANLTGWSERPDIAEAVNWWVSSTGMFYGISVLNLPCALHPELSGSNEMMKMNLFCKL